jgi:hypothetical protein
VPGVGWGFQPLTPFSNLARREEGREAVFQIVATEYGSVCREARGLLPMEGELPAERVPSRQLVEWPGHMD